MEVYTQKKIAFFIPIIMLPFFFTLDDVISKGGILSTIIFSFTVGFISYFQTSYSNSNTGETEKLQYRLLLSLPVSRKMLISSKYLMTCIWWLITYIWLIAVLFLLKYVFSIQMNQPILNWEVTFVSFCSAYFMSSLFYPLYYKFGYKIANIIGIMLFVIGSNFAGKIGLLNKDNNFISFIFDYPLVAFSTFTIAFVLITFITSLYIFTKTDY
ncbi:ABC-2 transporter permease [Paenibacillus albidus]|uniref:ABC-2 transporter permease n=1 Tax=Paenibacillus albidus TaxID=2041023 RepID=UPI00357105F0